MDGADDLPVLPPSLPPSLPPVNPAEPVTAEPSAAEPLLAEQLATRNVPIAASQAIDLGLPAATEGAVERPEFVRPDLLPMGDATTALLIGRVLLAVAALLIGIAARRSTGVDGAGRADAFWPVAASAGVFALVGLVGLIFWSARLAENARRLKTRSASARAMVWSWLLVVGYVALSCVTFLRVDVDGDLDPMPGVAAVGWLIVLAIAYGRLQGVFRGLSRTPPIVWITAFPLDLFAIGLLWWRLTSWPSPVGAESDAVELTANVAFGASAALLVNVLVFAWLAQQGSNSIYQRLGRLETQHRGVDPSDPEWFRSGLTPPLAVSSDAAGPRRPLIATRHLALFVAAFHVLWGLGLVVFGVLLAMLAFEYSDAPVFLGDQLLIDQSDQDRLALVATIVALVYVAAIITTGVWAVLAAINGRRITVHSPNPGTFAIAFAPMPLLAGAGLVIGGRLGYWLVVAGLTIGFFALILVNQMLMALAARQGGTLSGFSRWSLCLVLVYFAGVALNILYTQGAAQLGFFAMLALVQGVLIGFGGVIGFGAMRALEDTLRSHRRLARVDGAAGAGVNPSVPPPDTT